MLFSIFSSLIIANNNGSDKNKCTNIDFGYKAKDATVLFTAFLMPALTQQYLAQVQEAIKAQDINADDTVPNKMHLSLRFIGFVAPADFEKVKSCLIDYFSDVKVPTINLKPEGLLLLKNRNGSPRMILAKFESPELQTLYDTVNQKVEGFVGKSQFPKYLAHVTVATFNSDQQKQDSAQIEEKISSINNNQEIELKPGKLYLLGLPTEDLNTQYQDGKNYDEYYQFPQEGEGSEK